MTKVKFVDSEISKSITELLIKQNHRLQVLWATDCAEHVLQYFEENHDKDQRPREAIEAGRAWARDELSASEARTAAFAAHSAARETNNKAACAAARAAGHAAASAHVARHAIHAATYAAKAATYVINHPNSSLNTEKERIWQYQHLLDMTDETKKA